SIIFAKYIRNQLISQHLGDLFFSPDIELPLLSFRVGVLCGIEPPVGMSHFPEDKVQGLADNVQVFFFLGYLVEFAVKLYQQRIVVEHLFKMWDEPLLISRVSCKASAELVMNAARCHLVCGKRDKAGESGDARDVKVSQQKE